MFKVEQKEKIGKYLKDLIERQYESRREFGRQYLIAAGNADPSVDEINNMSNRLTQIIKGTKAIQIFDLPYFTGMLRVSCEQILSAGECSVPIASRVTNYSIACSKDPKEWEEYIRREDNLILNSDEYCKTVLDYALEFGNYAFIKFLMDHGYIWFDSGKEQDYVQTFGAGTSIKRRSFGFVDYDLESKLKTEDSLRTDLIALASDNEDIQMLEKLRARESPQLYYRAHYFSAQHPDFDSYYNERMVKHIAGASDRVLDYFTDPFQIQDSIVYKDGSERSHTFMFPYISKLLDLLISENSRFAETAIEKAIKHNEETYKKICGVIRAIKNDPRYSEEYMHDLWVEMCAKSFDFFENGSIVMLRAIYSSKSADKHVDGIITNVPHITRLPTSPRLRQQAERLNESYLKIKNIKEHLEDI